MDDKIQNHVVRRKTSRMRVPRGCLGGHDYVAEHVGCYVSKSTFQHRKGDNIGGAIALKVTVVQGPNFVIVDQRDRDFGISELQKFQKAGEGTFDFPWFYGDF